MKDLANMFEGILGDIESGIEDYVELLDRMKKDLAWVRRIRLDDAVYYEAAFFNVTRNSFHRASNKTHAELKRLLANFMVAAYPKYGCDNVADDIDNWEERTYSKIQFRPDDEDTDILHAQPDDYRWIIYGSGSFYHFFWDADYTHSLDQEELLVDKKTQQYSKKLINIAHKYGLELDPIF